MSFFSDNETWSMEPVAISDTDSQVKEDVEADFELNKNYSVTVTTVIAGYKTLTSSTDFSETP